MTNVTWLVVCVLLCITCFSFGRTSGRQVEHDRMLREQARRDARIRARKLSADRARASHPAAIAAVVTAKPDTGRLTEAERALDRLLSDIPVTDITAAYIDPRSSK